LKGRRREKKDGPRRRFIVSGVTDHSWKIDISGSSLYPRREDEMKMKTVPCAPFASLVYIVKAELHLSASFRRGYICPTL
jgi:hypothetical protein